MLNIDKFLASGVAKPMLAKHHQSDIYKGRRRTVSTPE